MIDLKQKGAYWDFKEEYSYNKADFLHDIICMSNNLEKRDAYLIYGLKDNGCINGISSSKKRKSNADIDKIECLWKKRFGIIL